MMMFLEWKTGVKMIFRSIKSVTGSKHRLARMHGWFQKAKSEVIKNKFLPFFVYSGVYKQSNLIIYFILNLQ